MTDQYAALSEPSTLTPRIAAARGIALGHPRSAPGPSRTDLAEDRTLLANERTFAGWMRTALACVALGVGFHALLPTMQQAWLPRAIATAFLLLAVLTIVSAERRSAAVMKRLSPHIVVSARPMKLRILTAAISLGSAALIFAIWLVDFR